MTQRLQKELDKLRGMLRRLGEQVVESLSDALHALRTSDLQEADAVIGRDSRIDRAEIDVEKECQHILTLLQPVAADLRYVMSVLKINADLERIADQAANIATQVTFLMEACGGRIQPLDGLVDQAAGVLQMVTDAAAALDRLDEALARGVIARDDEIDRFHRAMHGRVEQAVVADPRRAQEMICYLKISRELERTADLAVNICEDILFVTKGTIARHAGNV